MLQHDPIEGATLKKSYHMFLKFLQIIFVLVPQLTNQKLLKKSPTNCNLQINFLTKYSIASKDHCRLIQGQGETFKYICLANVHSLLAFFECSCQHCASVDL